MRLLSEVAKKSWAGTGEVTGELVVASASLTALDWAGYGGHLTEAMERFVYEKTDVGQKAICLVLEECAEPDIAGRIDLLERVGGLVTFGAFAKSESHFDITMREMSQMYPEFIGGELFRRRTDDLLTGLRKLEGTPVMLEFDGTNFNIDTIS